MLTTHDVFNIAYGNEVAQNPRQGLLAFIKARLANAAVPSSGPLTGYFESLLQTACGYRVVREILQAEEDEE